MKLVEFGKPDGHRHDYRCLIAAHRRDNENAGDDLPAPAIVEVVSGWKVVNVRQLADSKLAAPAGTAEPRPSSGRTIRYLVGRRAAGRR